MMNSARRFVAGVIGIGIASACATGVVGEEFSTEAMPTMAAEPSHGCLDAAGVRIPRPNVVESCNGEDDDCDGVIDEGFDLDGDHWVSCSVGDKPADCDDGDPDVHAGTAEVCNGKDDDCDGQVDEDFDDDGDGFFTCAGPRGAVDCDDTDRKVNPAALERCNGEDDDCDGQIDELPARLSGRLDPVDAHWALRGSASLKSGWSLLTPDVATSTGALWWNAGYRFDTFDVTARISVTAKSDGADGMAFAWVAGEELGVGGGGGGYGVSGLPGYALAIDTFTNEGEPAPPFFVLLDARTGTHLHRQSIPDIRDSKIHELRVRLEDGKVSAWLDGISYVYERPIPGYVPFVGHWGFTASTGGRSSTHWVSGVTMTFPEGQGCVL